MVIVVVTAAIMSLCREGSSGAVVAACGRCARIAPHTMNRLEREDEDGARAAVPRGGSGRTGLDEHAAADGFQTARLLQSLQALREPRRLQAWIVTTAKRQALLERRRGARHVSLAPADADDDAAPEWDLPGEGPLPDAQLDELQHMHRLRLAFERLDPRCRALLGALFRDDEPPAYEAIALQLDMPVGSIAPTRALPRQAAQEYPGSCPEAAAAGGHRSVRCQGVDDRAVARGCACIASAQQGL